jgi:hypothetical protein
MATEGLEDAENRAAEAAAAGDAAAEASALQDAARYGADIQQYKADADRHEPAAQATWEALPPAAALLRCVLQAFARFSSDERLAAAAYQTLQCAYDWAQDSMLPYVWEQLQQQLDQQFDQQVDGTASAEQPRSMAQLLLACAPEEAALPQGYRDIPCFNSAIPVAPEVSDLWSKIVKSAPAAVQEAVVGSLQEQLCCAVASSEAGASGSTSSNSGSTNCLAAPSKPCWGCCNLVTSRTSITPSSNNSAAHKAASLLLTLQRTHFTDLRSPGWVQLLKLQSSKLAAAADPAGVEALRKLQEALLLSLTRSPVFLGEETSQQQVEKAQQQLVRAALAGNVEAQKFLEEQFVIHAAGREVLFRQLPALVTILQAEPWLQQQQEGNQPQMLCSEQPAVQTQQAKQHDMRCVNACSILYKLVEKQEQAAVAQACCDLPPYLQQLLLGPAAVTSAAAADGSTDASAAAAAATESAAAAAFLTWLLLLAPKPGVTPAKATVLGHVTGKAPVLVLAALQQKQDAFAPQSLFARLVLRGVRGSYITPLMKSATARLVTQQAELRQLVTTLLQYAASTNSSSSGDAGSTGEVAGLSAAAADTLSAMLFGFARHPTAAGAVAAILAEQPQAELLLQTLRQAVLLGSGDAAVSGLARVLRGVCDRTYAAVQSQLAAFLQELVQQVLEQGNSMAAKALEDLIQSQPVQEELVQHTAAVLQAVQPDKPAQLQAAAWQLLVAWVGTAPGRAAVVQLDWLHIFEVMVQQGSWVVHRSEAASAAAGTDNLRVMLPDIWSNKGSSAAEAAAQVVHALVQSNFDAIES